jgi:hypothetical protein
MADPTTAAFDPIFWAHHSNIDRLWAIWDCLPNRVWGLPPSQEWLDGKAWWFVDADGSVKNFPRSHFFDLKALGVAYDDQDTSCGRPLSSTPLKGAEFVVLESMRQGGRILRAADKTATVGEGQGGALSATAPHTIPVAPSTTPAAGNRSLRALLAEPRPKRRVLVEITGVGYDQPPSVGFAVYVNLPQGAQPDPSLPNYVGNLDLFGLKHRGHMHSNEAGQLFDITALSRDPKFDPNAINVTIVPYDLLRSKSGAAPPRRSGNTVVGKVRVIVADDQEP